jgi:hypothetical protein
MQMFLRMGKSLNPHLRRLHAQAPSSASGARRTIQAYPGAFVSSSVLAAYILWYTDTRVVHNDAAFPVALSKARQESSTLLPGGDVRDSENLHAVVWGSNRCRLLPTRLDSRAHTEQIPNQQV